MVERFDQYVSNLIESKIAQTDVQCWQPAVHYGEQEDGQFLLLVELLCLDECNNYEIDVELFGTCI